MLPEIVLPIRSDLVLRGLLSDFVFTYLKGFPRLMLLFVFLIWGYLGVCVLGSKDAVMLRGSSSLNT